MLLQWTPRSKGVHLMFGGLYAAGLERYAHHRARGLSHDAASVRMVREILETAGVRVCAVCKSAWPDDGSSCPCGSATSSFHPWSPGDHKDANIKNLPNLIRSLIWNVEDRLTSPFTTLILSNGKPAVELSFNLPAFELDGEVISLSGHLDEVVEASGDIWIRDDKTTKGALSAQYFNGYSPNNQMSLYSLAGKIILDRPVRGVLVKAAQIGVNFTRFATAQVPRPAAVLDEWLDDTKMWVRQAKEFARRAHWPKNDKSCGNYGGCPFQKVCSISPSHRDAWLREDFEKREWNPLQARGDI